MEPRFSLDIQYSGYNLTSKSSDTPDLQSSSSLSVHDTPPNSVCSISHSEQSRKSQTDEAEEYPKKEFKKLTWGKDSYEGSVVADNLHGFGFYLTQKNGQKLFYDGQFYVNKLEGYGQIFYENGMHFQGLFKEHLRHGPGVLSYPDCSQDVGFWNGFRLIRLACVVGNDIVPTLASTHAGKSKLLGKRYLVPLCDEKSDIVRQILEQVGANEDIIASADVIYNVNIRNPRSLFFNKSFYDKHFFNEHDCMIKVYDTDDSELIVQDVNSELQDNSQAERIRNLKNKIHEVNENLNTFVAIKRNLTEKVSKCKSCCEAEESNGINGTIKTFQTARSQSSTAILNTFQGSNDFSVHSADIAKHFISADGTGPTNNDPFKEDIDLTEMFCPCDEVEYRSGLQSLEEELQNITTQETYYRNIRDELQKKHERANQWAPSDSLKFKLVKVNELWAWNNETSTMQMQKHCFKHRNSEDMVNFSVQNLILGNRKDFEKVGKHEELCRTFLLACSKGKKDLVKQCLGENKVHPNITDARGNSAIFYATAKNQQEIISILTTFGAKLDQINDEQLTPLSMAFLNYISVKNSCCDWEKAFLPETNVGETPELPKWYDIKSFVSVCSMSSKNSTKTSLDRNHSSQCRFSDQKLIELSQKTSTPVDRKKDTSSRSQPYVFNLECRASEVIKPVECESDTSIEVELNNIHLTITTLLNYRANPNSPEVPYTPMVLSLFTENPDLVEQIIKANADIHVLIEDNLSCLHVAASLVPCKNNTTICMVLANNGCNPDLKTLPNHWADRRSYFTGILPDLFEIEDFGKNALHLLCMRKDFEGSESDYFCSVAKILLDAKLDTSVTYLGHTPLSLAVLSGNMRLVQCLLTSSAFNPYQVLEYGMGNILTLYTLSRFQNSLPVDKCKEMLTLLFDMNVNLLHEVCDKENAIVFAEEGDNFFDQFLIEKETKKGAKSQAKKQVKQGSAVKDLMKSLARQTIVRHVQMTLTEILYNFIEDDVLKYYEICSILSNDYLTPQIALKNLIHLFQSRNIDRDRLDSNNIKTLLNFVDLHKKFLKKTVSKAGKKDKIQSEQNQEDNMETMTESIELTINSPYAPLKFLNEPGLDNPLMYQICFHCLRGRNKELQFCPRCQMIQFCSEQCNKLNVKLKTPHGCNLVFYGMTVDQISEITNGICLRDRAREVKETCMVRLKITKEIRLLAEEQKLMDMWRADTYGTKFLHLNSRLKRAVHTRKGQKINMNIGLLKGILERQFLKGPGVNVFSLENLLTKLESKMKSEATSVVAASCSRISTHKRSTLAGSTVLSGIIELFEKQESESECK